MKQKGLGEIASLMFSSLKVGANETYSEIFSGKKQEEEAEMSKTIDKPYQEIDKSNVEIKGKPMGFQSNQPEEAQLTLDDNFAIDNEENEEKNQAEEAEEEKQT